jgi:hypothetical protein
MAATKTIYKLNWQPSKPMAVATIVSLAAVLMAPVLFDNLFSEQQLDFKVIWNCWFVVFVQALLSLGGTLFFYEGIPRLQQFRILSLQLAIVFIFATISNTMYRNELCEILSRGEMIVHLAAWGAVNVAAMICTLFVYRLEPVKVEVGSKEAVPSTPLWLSIPPAAVPMIVAALAIVLMPLAPNLLPRDKSIFRCTVPFFIGGQILFGIVTVNWLLNKKTWGQKIRHALMIVATSMGFGTLCNLINVRSTLRPGLRIEISAGEYLLMNLAAMLCVIGYFVWERIRNGELAKRAELLAATQAPPAAAESGAAPTQAGTAPSVAVSQPAQPTSTPASPAVATETESNASSTPLATPADAQTTSTEASPAVSLSLKSEHPEPVSASNSTSPDAAKSAKGQGSSPNKGPSKNKNTGSPKNGGSQKGGSQKTGDSQKDGSSGSQKSGSSGQSKGSPKNNGKKSDGGSAQKGNNGNGTKKKSKD